MVIEILDNGKNTVLEVESVGLNRTEVQIIFSPECRIPKEQPYLGLFGSIVSCQVYR